MNSHSSTKPISAAKPQMTTYPLGKNAFISTPTTTTKTSAHPCWIHTLNKSLVPWR